MSRTIFGALTVLIVLTSSLQAQCTKDIDCKGDRICVKGECISPGQHQTHEESTTSKERIRKYAIMASFNAGPVFGAGGAGLNIDEGVELQFSGGEKFLWGAELDYHVVVGGFGFAAKTGPAFNMSGTGPKGLLFQFYPGFKAEVITGLNSVGNFLVPIIEFDANLIYQHVSPKGFLLGVGGQLAMMIVPGTVDEIDRVSGAAFGIAPVLHIGGSF